jgi:hypothetical protein
LFFHLLKAVSVCNVVNGDAPVGVPIIGMRNGPESFLSSRVPDLHLDYFVVYFKSLDLEVNSYGAEVVFCERVVREPHKHRRLSCVALPDQNYFVESVEVIGRKTLRVLVYSCLNLDLLLFVGYHRVFTVSIHLHVF